VNKLLNIFQKINKKTRFFIKNMFFLGTRSRANFNEKSKISKINSNLIDWEAFLEYNPHLKERGITTKRQAKEHYFRCGPSENLLVLKKGEAKRLRQKIARYDLEYRSSFRSKTINRLIKEKLYSSYLEIGVLVKELNFDRIKIDKKESVDPGYEGYSEATHVMTSDEFFEQNKEMFDIIFIDGLHQSYQVSKDIQNSLAFLNKGGTIVCHDMNPLLEFFQRVPRELEKGTWNGDCWKSFVTLRMTRNDLKMCVIDVDWGLGIISKGSQEMVEKEELTFENLEKNRKAWLNLISFEEFEQNTLKNA